MKTHPILTIAKRNLSIAFMVLMVIGFSSMMGLVFFMRGQDIMETQLQEQLRGIATSAALLFRDVNLDTLQTSDDIAKPEYVSAIQKLNMVRSQNPGIRFAYILRATKDAQKFQFVADADSLYPFDPFDLNGDGVIDESDELAPPGTEYDVSEIPEIVLAMKKATTTQNPYTDQWGSFMSAFAPVRFYDGHLMGVIGIDMEISQYQAMSQSIFSPIALLLMILASIMVGGYIVLFIRNRRLETMSKLESDRLSILQTTSHQLGTPVTLLRWALEGLRERMGEKAKHAPLADHLTDMDSSIAWIEDTLQSFYRADQIRENALHRIDKPVVLKEIVETVFREMKTYGERKHIRYELDMDGEWIIQTDSTLIRSVVMELIRNAVDYSRPHSAVTVRITRKGANVLFEIRDEGCGVPSDDIEQLFQKFSRASNAREMKPNGSGLGLYIARGAIEQSGGKMWLESELGHGTTVYFTLPISE